MSVEVVAGAVVAHGGARVGASGGDLHVTQADTGVEHGRDKGAPEHVPGAPRHPDPGGSGWYSVVADSVCTRR